MCESWFLNWAPCPPFFIDNIYVVFITYATKQNLSVCEIETIREKCDLAIPTTTTTSSTKSTTTTSTTLRTSSTTASWPTVSPTLETENVTEDRNISATFPPTHGNETVTYTIDTFSNTTLESQANGSTFSETTDATYFQTNTLSSSNDSITENFTTFHSFSTPTIDLNATVGNVTEVSVGATSSGEAWCRGVCLILVSTTVACLAIILLTVVALLLRKIKDDGKTERGRSRARTRSRYAEVPNTQLYDSVDLPSYSNRSSGSEIWQDSSDYSLRSVLRHDPSDFSIKEHTFVNPAFRRSFEPPARSSVFWYDPDAADPDYLQRNANLTRQSRSQDRKSPPKNVLNNQKEVDKNRARSRSASHVSLREYVPKALQYVDNLEQLPYQNCNGCLKRDNYEGRENSQIKRSLPRTPLETNQNAKQEPMTSHQRPSYRRSRSYDIDSPRQSSSREEDGFYTVDVRHSRKHYVKNSQRNKQNSQGNRERSVKAKLHRQSDGDVDEIMVMDQNLGQGHVQRLSNQNLDFSDARVISSNLRPGSYKYGSHHTFVASDESDHYYNRKGRSRSHRELRERSPSIQVRRGGRIPTYRPLNPDQIYVFQTKL